MAKLICLLTSLIVALSLNAQATKHCWGISDSVVKNNLTTDDRIALRLYPSAPILKWHDFSTYKFRGGGKRAVWISYAVAGILHGGREAYHAQPDVFERRFNASHTSFFGSQQWKRQYYDNNPELPHKPNAWNGLRDYWHFSGATTKYILIGGAFTIGASKQPVKYRIIDTLIAFAGFSASASLTYTLLR